MGEFLSNIQLVIPTSTEDLAATSGVSRKYVISLGFDLCFQDFEGGIANLPGDYAPPRGALVLGHVDGAIAGCCALRPLDSSDYVNAAEMKRLYVRPAFRCLGVGRQLAEAILDVALMAGYDSVLLDTLDDMEIARAMYEELGFKEIPTYYHNPLAGAHYLKVDLLIRPIAGVFIA